MVLYGQNSDLIVDFLVCNLNTEFNLNAYIKDFTTSSNVAQPSRFYIHLETQFLIV